MVELLGVAGGGWVVVFILLCVMIVAFMCGC